MYDPNNYNYSDGGYSSGSYSPADPECKPPRRSGAGKIIAALLAVVIIGGAAGYGGAYLANSNAAPISAEITEEVSNLPETEAGEEAKENQEAQEAPDASAAADNGENASASGLANNSTASKASSPVKNAIKKATPSVALITANYSSGGTSTGTGIIFSSDGYIITNAHVILSEESSRTNYNYDYNDPFSFFEQFYNNNYSGGSQKSVVEASEVIVTLDNGKEYKAKIVGSDANTDLAVLKISASGLTAAKIGDSANLEMGDEAITLGYPLGLGLSASTGIISGLDKELTIEVAGGSASMTLLQTDASINPGNSGGPLLNINGEVVGITSSKIVSSSVDGVGFAIPITDALPLIEELMTTGKIKNTVPKIGITGMDITPAVRRYYNLPVDSGILVSAVEAGSCAESAGIEEGDIIVGADGKTVKNMDTLVSIKNKHKAGDKMTITLARNGENVDVELILDAKD